ncbi:Aldo/keto reductase [Auriscalpium vulgare]|uniref:Aldo/keto reductase n=1 Tax=Auriscalpium vulgare TaxID=40419 RepID=A0ACB8S8X7_9AGAM|nr:Aldo/keto reductase [Auriscalpium vulgare]
MGIELGSPEIIINLPPLDSIPDGPDDLPTEGRLVGEIGPYKLSSLAFGAATWSHFYNTDEHLTTDVPLRAIRLALRYGIRTFDTSPYYDDSEIVLGTALKALELEFPRASYQLVTKCGRYGADYFDYTPETIRASVRRSLQRLHTEYLDVVYLHDVEFVAPTIEPRKDGKHAVALGEQAEAYGLKEGGESQVRGDGDQKILDAIAELRKMQSEGLIKHVGISGLPLPTLLRIALLVLNNPPYKPLDILMSYTQLTLQNHNLLTFLPAFIHRAHIPQLVTASPLCMGLLTPTTPNWHPAPPAMREAGKEALKRAQTWPGGLPAVAVSWAVKAAGGAESPMPTVVGLSSPAEVHRAVKAWRDGEEGSQELDEYARRARQAFEETDTNEWTWAFN